MSLLLQETRNIVAVISKSRSCGVWKLRLRMENQKPILIGCMVENSRKGEKHHDRERIRCETQPGHPLA